MIPEPYVQRVLDLFSRVEREGKGWKVPCPCHEDTHPSLGLAIGREGKILVNCRVCGAKMPAVAQALGLQQSDFFPPREGAPTVPVVKRELVATYEYVAEDGAPLYEVRRYFDKSFPQYRPDGTPGIEGIRRVVYHLDLIQNKKTVYLVEGEKDADNLIALGIWATCNSGGAGKWTEAHTAQLVAAGVKQVVVLPDQDQAGALHGQTVARSCHAAGLLVKVVNLPELPEKGDVSDYLAAGHSRKDLAALVKAAPTVDSTALSTPLSSPSAGVKKPPVTWRSGTELDATPISYLVEGLIPRGWLGAIAGRDGRGKTLLGMEIARSVLTGEKLFGQFAVQQGNVFLMLLDDPENLVRERLDALGILDHPNLKVATAKDVDLTDKPGMLAYLKETLPPLDPTWVLIDALYKFFPGSGRDGQDQANSAGAMGPVMTVFDELANAIKGTLALVAHDNKAGSDIAGSQIIRNELKWILRLVLPPEFEKKREEGVMTDERVLQLNKLKTGRNTSWHLKVGPPGEWTFNGDSAAYRRTTLGTRIEGYLFDHGAHTVEELAKALKARPAEARAACLQLHLVGKITRAEQPRADGKSGRGRIVYDHPVPLTPRA